MKDTEFNNIYCLVHAERLSYQVCEAAFKEYDSLSQGVNGNLYRVNFTRQNFCFLHNRNVMPIDTVEVTLHLVTAVTVGQYV